MPVHKISPETIEDLRIRLEDAIGGSVASIYMEVQDDGEFLLVSMQAKPNTDKATANEVVDKAESILAPAIPPRVGDHSWMALLSENGQVMEVRFPEML